MTMEMGRLSKKHRIKLSAQALPFLSFIPLSDPCHWLGLLYLPAILFLLPPFVSFLPPPSMSRLLSNLWTSSPSSGQGVVELPMGSKEPLLTNNDKELDLDDPGSEKCELRIDGMTCGSCVEVSPLPASPRRPPHRTVSLGHRGNA